MENASKALIMAAGILIGMIIVSIFVYEMAYVSSTGSAYQERIAKAQIEEFNSQFEIYLYGDDGELRTLKAQHVATIYNLVREWNQTHESDTITLNIPDNSSLFEDNTVEQFLMNYSDNLENIYNFYCTDIEYNENTGRVEIITIDMEITKKED